MFATTASSNQPLPGRSPRTIDEVALTCGSYSKEYINRARWAMLPMGLRSPYKP